MEAAPGDGRSRLSGYLSRPQARQFGEGPSSQSDDVEYGRFDLDYGWGTSLSQYSGRFRQLELTPRGDKKHVASPALPDPPRKNARNDVGIGDTEGRERGEGNGKRKKEEKELDQLKKEIKQKNETISSLNKKKEKSQTVTICDNLIIKNKKFETDLKAKKEKFIDVKTDP